MTMRPADPNITTADVLDILQVSGKSVREWGRAVDGTPMLAACTGGDRQPPIFITAGAHATETAGVHAALRLLETLDSEREVHVLPLRDPLGFAGVGRCLSFAAGRREDDLEPRESLDFLQAHGEEILEEGELRLFQLGRFGFLWGPNRPGLETFWEEFGLMGRLARERPEILKPLLGKSIMLVDPAAQIDGSEGVRRCWHSVLSGEGEWLHLNRFFGRADAPSEVAAVDHLLTTLKPGLICDLHEGNGRGFWMPIPRPRDHADRVLEMTRAFFGYIEKRGYPVTDYEDWQATDGIGAPDPDWMLPEPSLPGMFWLNQDLRAEGHNLMSYAGQFGVGYGTEGPMVRRLADTTLRHASCPPDGLVSLEPFETPQSLASC